MAYTPAENFPELLESMKRAAAALRDAGVPYMLGGGLAAWARGGPPTEHDVDFFVRPEDAEQRARRARRRGDAAERPPEAWLLKAWDGDTLIDLIHSPAGGRRRRLLRAVRGDGGGGADDCRSRRSGTC